MDLRDAPPLEDEGDASSGAPDAALGGEEAPVEETGGEETVGLNGDGLEGAQPHDGADGDSACLEGEGGGTEQGGAQGGAESRGAWAHMFRQGRGGLDRRRRGHAPSHPYASPHRARGDGEAFPQRRHDRNLPPWGHQQGRRGLRRREEEAPQLSTQEKRWMCLRALFVTIGDELSLIPQQIQKLAREAENVIVQAREEANRAEEERRRKLRQAQGEGEDAAKGAAGASEPDEVMAVDIKEMEPSAQEKKDEDLDTLLVTLIVDCASQLPLKVGIYACLVGLWYKKSRLRPLCARIVEQSFIRFEEAIKQGNFSDAKLLLRFLLALSGSFVVAPESVFDLMKALLSMSAELAPSATTDQILLVVLAALPWLSARSWETLQGSVGEVLALAQQIGASSPSAEVLLLQQATSPIRAAAGGALGGEEGSPILVSLGLDKSRLSSLFEAIASMIQSLLSAKPRGGVQLWGGLLFFGAQESWKSKATLRFYQSPELFPLLKPVNDAAARVPLCVAPTLSLSVDDLRSVKAFPVERSIRLPVSIEKVDIPLSLHDRWILEDHFSTILRNFRDNVTLCAEALLRVPVDHEQFEFVLVECLFSAMLRLPHAPSPGDVSETPFFITRVLHRVCQMQNLLVGVTEAGLTSLLKHAAHFDFQALRVLADFFAYWLNVWEGRMSLLEEWLGLSIPPAYLKVFVQHAFEKAFRFRYRPHLLELLPECVLPYTPPDAVPSCPYTAEAPQQSLAFPGAPPPPVGLMTLTSYAGHIEFSEVQKLLLFSFKKREGGIPPPPESDIRARRMQSEDETGAGGSDQPAQEEGMEAEADAETRERSERDAEEQKRDLMRYELARLLRGRLHRKTWKRRPGFSHDGERPGVFPPPPQPSSPSKKRSGEEDEPRDDAEEEPREEGDDARTPYEDDEAEGHVWSLTDLAQVLVFALLTRGLKTLTHSERLVANYFPVFEFLKRGATKKALRAMQPPDFETQNAQRPGEVDDESDVELEDEEERGDEAEMSKAERRSQEVEEAFLKAIFDFWKNSRQKTVLTVRHFERYGVVSKEGTVRFVFDSLSATERDDSRIMELFDLLLQLSIEGFELKKEKALALVQTRGSADEEDEQKREERQAAVAAAAEAAGAVQTLLHFILIGFMRELLREEHAPRRIALEARLVYLARDYARFVDLPRLQEQIGDSMTDDLHQLLALSKQVQTQFFFLDREPGGLLGPLAAELDDDRDGLHAEEAEVGE
ncbi:hypothetical protein BESB_004020 [Besnoitia besnoiti]|uniref:MIF4G-like type 2 domain-containing protein n=1 Tax=Besnoitia besnoiti TaxID=94643 RepID=A0A2A9MNF0_BESBE|nr:hypothetical protein BESB_004020 [Besnoitia besnoiti]PFH38061.1 hypothetical protein BESB_004020 [Besnoitia besnoiti]